VLSIGHNGLREDGMSSLVVALRTLPRLHSLNVTHNAMGAAGLRRLLDDGLPALPNLGHLCLGECNALDESALSEVLGECALRHAHGLGFAFSEETPADHSPCAHLDGCAQFNGCGCGCGRTAIGVQARPSTAPLPRLEQFSARCSSGRRRTAAATSAAAASAETASMPTQGRSGSRAAPSAPAMRRTSYMGGPTAANGRPGTAMASYELRPSSPTRRQLPAYGNRARPATTGSGSVRPDTAR
jgi:hypothetical protein